MAGILIRVGLTAVLIGSGAAGTAVAQSADKVVTGLEEIVVTATRREERLQDVPISISAFNQEKLDAQGLRNIDDLTRLTPGVTFSRNGMGSSANYNDEGSAISIRGIDSSAGASTTAIYIDDTPIQSRHIGFGAVNVFPALFDVDRVEVLRGPQGTLFGAGAEGGALRFITPTPGLRKNSGYTRAEFSQTSHGDPSYEFGAAFGGPIIEDVLGFRGSVSFRRDGGWVDRVNYTLTPNADPAQILFPTVNYAATTKESANWQETLTLRAALTWKVSDNVSITPSVYYQRLQLNDTAAYWLSLSDASAGVYRNGNALTNPSIDPYYLAAVKVEWDIGAVHLTSNTAYFSRDQHSISDYTQYLRTTWAYLGTQFGFGSLASNYPPPGAGGRAFFGDKQHNFYQEFRLASVDASARVTWNTGVFFSHTNENIPEDIIDPTLEAETGNGVCAIQGLTCPGGLIAHAPTQEVIEKQIAVFGDVSYKISDKLKATVGLRVAKDDVSSTTAVGGAFGGLPLDPLSVSGGASSDKPVTPKFVLSYQPDRDDMYYASASKGYRSGGVNLPLGVSCDGDLRTLGLPNGSDGRPHPTTDFSSDSLWSFEIGAKNSLFNHSLQINSSLFVIDWKGIQQNIYLPSCGGQYVANLGQVKSRGGEVQLNYKPTQPLSLGLTASYTDAKYGRASCAGSLVFNGSACAGATGTAAPTVSEGDHLLGAPWTFIASAEYAASFPMFGGRTGYVRFDYVRTTAQTTLIPGRNFHNALFDDTVPGLPATENLSLRAGMRFSGFDLSVFANNLTNDHPLLFASRDIAYNCVTGLPCGAPGSPPNTSDLYFGRGVRPRTIGLTGTYRF